MSIIAALLTIAGLCAFETISSVDNAIINAEVLKTMGERARRWFLFWGLLFAVFIVRGLLPWFIVWTVLPSLGPLEALTATFSSNPEVITAVEESAPILLVVAYRRACVTGKIRTRSARDRIRGSRCRTRLP